jgi:TetR/AcrR family transcriptional regulator, repressor of fatR-cypB operon
MKTSDKRADIFQAALELISEKGFHGAPMAELAKKAGVSAGTIYLYFESKEILITELYQELENKIMTTVQEDYPFDRPIREQFLFLISKLVHHFINNPLHFRYMEQFFNSPFGASMHRDKLLNDPGNQKPLFDIFEQGIEQKVIKELPKFMLFSLAMGPLLILIRDHTLGFVILDDLLIEQFTESCWDAIKR